MSIRILLADDHLILLDCLCRLLSEESDMEVVGSARDGYSVLKFAATLKPDVVVMDISMPGMNGIEATRLMTSSHPEIKVLVLSVCSNSQHVAEMFDAGAVGYIAKENASDELLIALRSVMKQQRHLCPLTSKIMAGEKLRYPGIRLPRLGPREVEILRHVAEGRTSQRIAEQLFISVSTVDVHRKNIMQKLDLHNTAALTTYAIRNGLISM